MPRLLPGRTLFKHPSTRARLERILVVIEELRDYWPLTLRQVHYSIVSRYLTPNNRDTYRQLSEDLTSARLLGHVPWEAIEDRVRTLHQPWRSRTVDDHVREVTSILVNDYRRDLLQGQPVAVEVWVEKDALASPIKSAADPYGVPVCVAKGNVSTSFTHELAARALSRAERLGQRTHIAYFADFDPSGQNMLPNLLKRLGVEHDVGSHVLDGHIYSLTKQQIEDFDLPHDGTALKSTDPLAAKHRASHGNLSVELDALPPRDLMQLVRSAVEQNLDMTTFREQEALVESDLERLRRVSAVVERALDTI